MAVPVGKTEGELEVPDVIEMHGGGSEALDEGSCGLDEELRPSAPVAHQHEGLRAFPWICVVDVPNPILSMDLLVPAPDRTLLEEGPEGVSMEIRSAACLVE